MNLLSFTLFLGILVHETSHAKDEDTITLSCPAHRPCRTAFASYNPITLKCDRPENAPVYWQYLDIFHPHARAVTFTQSSGSFPQDEDLDHQEHLKVLDLRSRSVLLSGNLKLLSPRVQDTGIYTCRDEKKHLAYYEIDIQDAQNIYISHARLGHRVHPNTTIDLGEVGTAEVFTVWSGWQPCDRCGMLGERKKVGFCYIKITKNSTVIEEPGPCGLLQSHFSPLQFNHTPELRIETCDGTCHEIASTENEDLTMVVDDYHTYLHADALFRCPMSSIYKPVYWEHGNASFTRLQQMMNNASYVLDKATGGGTLFIPVLNKSEEGVYRCYVDRRLTGRFHVIFLNVQYTSVPQHSSMFMSIITGLSVFLAVLLFVIILQYCKETTDRVIH
ncbi:protein FAM187B [Rhinoderma darwinii]|uniref:protein FAM187B n=1 Tax=Rhinoderma darwinii TaxID=43563 RepID=UPI003F66D2EC